MIRQLIKTYSITGEHEITVTGYSFDIEDIRLLVDETIPAVLASSMQKGNILSVNSGVITLATTTPTLSEGDVLTIEIAVDNIAKEANATTNKEAIINAINNAQPDLSAVAKEAAATTNKQAILDALTAAITATQGTDSSATLTVLKTAIAEIDTTGISLLTNFFGLDGTVHGYTFPTDTEVTDALNDLWNQINGD